MNKEPIGLYIFRFVSGFALFAFMCMLYWSSTIVENHLQSLITEISQIKSDLISLRTDNEKTRSDLLQAIHAQQDHIEAAFQQGAICAIKAADLSILPTANDPKKNEKQVAIAEEKFPNLLGTDPFFLNTLPKLLGKDFVPRGIQRTAAVGKPDNLHPFSAWSQVSTWNARCNVSAAGSAFGKYETFVQDMALRIEERINEKTKVPEFWIFLRNNVFWQPLKQSFFSSDARLAPQFLRKNQVTAEDFKFFFDAMMNPYVQEPGAVALRTYYSALEEIEVIDPLTFIVRWKTEQIKGEDGNTTPKIKYMAKQMTGGLRPLPSFVYKYFMDGKKIIEDDSKDAYRTNSVWAQNFSQHWAKNVIVSCGAWIFEGMTDRQITFKRNSDFFSPNAALTEGIETQFKDSPDNIWQEFKNNLLDSYSLQPGQMVEFENFLNSAAYKQQAAQGASINRLDFVGRTYSYIGWNEAKPYFKSAKVRQALTMAIDRRRIIQENLNGLGIEINGTFYRYSPSYDDSLKPWPFNPQVARSMLEEEGWYDMDGDGIIEKMVDGKRIPFRFSLTYFVKNPTTKSVSEYVATALKEIGIDVKLNGVDVADLSAVFDDKEFDALALAWSLGTPPEDPRQLWHSDGAKEKGSSNAIGFANSEVDSIIDQLDYEYDTAKRIALYHKFDKIIHEEQPYTFLFTPKTVFLYREYLKNVFIPADRQDLIPGANVAEPDPSIFWLNSKK
ncbi:MAG TPA: ABC transporter substrate-binding protein [Parachlamydiaceae bacterium]|nr:ABC transporter substrate-binding protein [Parachlamydiaceae bacterium]